MNKHAFKVLCCSGVALVFSLSAPAPTPAAPKAALENDAKTLVPRGHWSYEAVQTVLVGLRLPSGESSKPQWTRAEMAMVVAGLIESAQAVRKGSDAVQSPNRNLPAGYDLRPKLTDLTDLRSDDPGITNAEIKDLLIALRREYAKELARLKVTALDSTFSDPTGRQNIMARDPFLLKLQQRLTPTLAALQSQTTVTSEGDQLVAHYQTQMFAVHGIAKNGYISGTYHEEQGPNNQGFLLRLSVLDGPYNGAASISQELRKPYWTTFINAYPIAFAEDAGNSPYRGEVAPVFFASRHLWMSLSFGSGVDARIIETIKSIVKEEEARLPDPKLATKEN